MDGDDLARNVNDIRTQVAGDLLRTGKHEIEPLGAKFVALHKRLVAQTEFAASFGRSGIIAEENHLDFGTKQGPTAKGVALNNTAVVAEGFPGGKECEHPAKFSHAGTKKGSGWAQGKLETRKLKLGNGKKLDRENAETQRRNRARIREATHS